MQLALDWKWRGRRRLRGVRAEAAAVGRAAPRGEREELGTAAQREAQAHLREIGRRSAGEKEIAGRLSKRGWARTAPSDAAAIAARPSVHRSTAAVASDVSGMLSLNERKGGGGRACSAAAAAAPAQAGRTSAKTAAEAA